MVAFLQRRMCWEVEKFVVALELRSLRAALWVLRLPVWEQAGDFNSECFSPLKSWSFQTRIPQRTRAQNIMEPCVVYWSLFTKLGCRLRNGRSWRCRWRRLCAVVLSSWVTTVKRSAGVFLVSHVATVARHAYLDIPAWVERKRRLQTLAHRIYSGSSLLGACWV